MRKFRKRAFSAVGNKRSRRRFIGKEIPKIRTQLTTSRLSQHAREVAFRFFRHKLYHPKPVPYEELTPLQKRMQSGGA